MITFAAEDSGTKSDNTSTSLLAVVSPVGALRMIYETDPMISRMTQCKNCIMNIGTFSTIDMSETVVLKAEADARTKRELGWFGCSSFF